MLLLNTDKTGLIWPLKGVKKFAGARNAPKMLGFLWGEVGFDIIFEISMLIYARYP